MRLADEPFLRLFEKHARWIYRRLRRVLRDEHLREDAVQEAFLALWRKGPGLHRDLLVDVKIGAAWLRTTGYREARAILRDRARLQHQQLQHDVGESRRDRGGDVRLRSAIDAIPVPEMREALQMRIIDGLSYDEIAGILEVRRGTVSSWISRGRLFLRQILKKEESCPSPSGAPRTGGEEA